MMYLNDDKNFMKEFFYRTNTIISQYSNAPNLQNENYDVTLFCNCLVGLFVFPEQKYFKKIKKSLLSEENYKLLKKSILKKDKQKYTLRLIFSRMRNAVAHGHIKFPKSNSTKDKQIHSITFYDDRNDEIRKSYNDRDLKNFEFCLEIDVNDLKKILDEFCNNLFKEETTR